MKIVIFGCGRTGSALALQLSGRGHQVTVVERDPTVLRRLGKNHGCRVVVGSGLEDDILRQAEIESADCFFALTRGDNTNLMAAQIVRIKFNVPKICVKVADPHRAEAYRKLGYVCVNPSALSAGLMRDWLLDEPMGPIDSYNVLCKEMEV